VTTVVRFCDIGSVNGSSQPSVASICESRKTIISPLTIAAPAKRERIRPSRFFCRTIITFPRAFA
jgi:hypothetical protein